MDIYSKARHITTINEKPIADLVRAQADVYDLFPPEDDRVKAVAAKQGDTILDREEPGLWFYKIKSATKSGVEYDATVHFSNIEKLLAKYVPDMGLWTSDKKKVDLRKLAREIYDDADLKVSCNCPAALYWGFNYIQTQKNSHYGDAETRPPVKRNPDKHGVACKHMHMVMNAFPWYKSTIASHLKRFYSAQISDLEKKTLATKAGVAKAADFLKQKEEERGKQYTRGSVKAPVDKKKFKTKVKKFKTKESVVNEMPWIDTSSGTIDLKFETCKDRDEVINRVKAVLAELDRPESESFKQELFQVWKDYMNKFDIKLDDLE